MPDEVAKEIRANAFANATPTKIKLEEKTVPIYSAEK